MYIIRRRTTTGARANTIITMQISEFRSEDNVCSNLLSNKIDYKHVSIVFNVLAIKLASCTPTDKEKNGPVFHYPSRLDDRDTSSL